MGTDWMRQRGLEIDAAIECCDACQETGLCGAHERQLEAFADACQAEADTTKDRCHCRERCARCDREAAIYLDRPLCAGHAFEALNDRRAEAA